MCFDKYKRTTVKNAVERNHSIPLPGNVFLSKNPSGHHISLLHKVGADYSWNERYLQKNSLVTIIVLWYFPIQHLGFQILAESRIGV